MNANVEAMHYFNSSVLPFSKLVIRKLSNKVSVPIADLRMEYNGLKNW